MAVDGSALCAVTMLGLPDFEVSAAGEYGGELEGGCADHRGDGRVCPLRCARGCSWPSAALGA